MGAQDRLFRVLEQDESNRPKRKKTWKGAESRKSRPNRFGFDRGRLRPCETDDAIQSVVDSCVNNPTGRLRFPATELCRLLIESMTEQTCRDLIKKLHDLELITYEVRGKRGRQEAFVESDGALENYFREHLDWLAHSLAFIGSRPRRTGESDCLGSAMHVGDPATPTLAN
jgi:hypothetical protein